MSETRSIWNLKPYSTGEDSAARLIEEYHKGKVPAAKLPEANPVTPAAKPEERLKFINETSTRLLSEFSKVDTTDNSFLGTHELAANKSIPGVQCFVHKHSDISKLHADGIRGYYSFYSQDHLGISRDDLLVLKAISSSNPNDRSDYISTRTWEKGGAFGAAAGFAISTASLLPLTTKGLRVPGLVGLGVGLGVGVLSYKLSRDSATFEYGQLRDKWSRDVSVDTFTKQNR